MPDTELPEVLKEVQGLKLAAVGKLQRQQRQQLQQLSELLISMETAVQVGRWLHSPITWHIKQQALLYAVACLPLQLLRSHHVMDTW